MRVVDERTDISSSVNFQRTVDRLLLSVPVKYLTGLEAIVLRDAGGLSSREKKKRKKRPGKVLLGTYYRASATELARIHLFVDVIARDWPVILLRFPPLRDFLMAKVLFHELGHHIDAKIAPVYGDSEVTAERWTRQLTRDFLQRRYWYFLPIMKHLGRAVKAWRKRKRAGKDDTSIHRGHRP